MFFLVLKCKIKSILLPKQKKSSNFISPAPAPPPTGPTHKCPVKKLTIVFNILSYNILEGIFTVGGFEIRY